MDPYSIPKRARRMKTGDLPRIITQLDIISAPAIRTLPPEILALVFHHAIQLLPRIDSWFRHQKPSRTSPLLLGSVCSHWRQVAWSTPLLWTYIGPVPTRCNAQHSDAALLRLYFQNACTLPVSLQIELDHLHSSPSAATEEILRAVFLENSHSIGALMFTSTSSSGQQWAMLTPKLAQSHFPSLHRLEIEIRHTRMISRGFNSSLFNHAPNLSQALFSGYQLSHKTFLEQITVLELSSLPIDQCLESLIRCPNLVDFSCTSPQFLYKPVDSAMNRRFPVTLLHLRKFKWSGSLAKWDVVLYTYVRLPNLTHLTLGNVDPLSRPLDVTVSSSATNSPSTDPNLWKFFLRHITNLTTLECEKFHSVKEWLDIFDIFSSTVNTLRLNTSTAPASEITRLLRSLLIEYAVEGLTSRNYFPNLKYFSANPILYPSTIAPILDVLCSRRIRPATPGLPTPGCLLRNTPFCSASDRSFSPDSLAPSSTPGVRPTHLPLDEVAATDYLINAGVDACYWSSHPRLEEAIIKIRELHYGIGEREKNIASMLKESGLNLEVLTDVCMGSWL